MVQIKAGALNQCILTTSGTSRADYEKAFGEAPGGLADHRHHDRHRQHPVVDHHGLVWPRPLAAAPRRPGRADLVALRKRVASGTRFCGNLFDVAGTLAAPVTSFKFKGFMRLKLALLSMAAMVLFAAAPALHAKPFKWSSASDIPTLVSIRRTMRLARGHAASTTRWCTTTARRSSRSRNWPPAGAGNCRPQVRFSCVLA